MLSCRIRMAGPMSRKTWCTHLWLRSVPGSVSEFCERFGSRANPGTHEGCDVNADPLSLNNGSATISRSNQSRTAQIEDNSGKLLTES